MSLCKAFGKDKVIFATKEDHEIPSTVVLPPPEPPQGLITTSGEVNWGFPCLGGMATGPCGVQFRDAFSYFQYSEAEPKGSDCYVPFKTMQDCFTQYPNVYSKNGDDDGDDNDIDLLVGGLEDMAEPESVAHTADADDNNEEEGVKEKED